MKIITRTVAIVFGVIFTLGGCSSITGQTQQSVSVETLNDKGPITGALCDLSNDKGKWFITTPGSVVIGKSNENLAVICKKDGTDPGLASVVSQTGAGMVGNVGLALLIPIVGIVGAIMDHSSGAVYQYPTSLKILMGQTITIDTPAQTPTANATTKTPTPTGTGTLTQITITADGVEQTTGVARNTSGSTAPVATPSVSNSVTMGAARDQCIELGIKQQTDEFGQCVLRLSK